MSAPRGVGLVLAALVVAPSASHAAQPIDGIPDTGPVLAAGHVVWGDEPDLYNDSLLVYAANEHGRSFVVARYARPAPGWHLYFPRLHVGLAGSASRFAYIWGGNDGTFQSGAQSIDELWTVSAAGALRVSECDPTSVDVDRDTVAWSSLNRCDGAVIFVRDVATGTPAERIDAPVGAGHEVKLAGRYLAWSEMAFWEEPRRNEVVVYDRESASVAYRMNVEPLIPPEHPHGYEWHYDLQPDGKLVMAYRRIGFSDAAEVAWFSPAEPFAHRIPVPLQSPYVSVANDLVGACRRDPDEAVVFDLTGRTVDHLDTTHPTWACHVAFDGERVAWLNAARKPSIYFDRFPASEPETPPLITEAPAGSVAPRPGGLAALPHEVDCRSFAGAVCTVKARLHQVRRTGRTKAIGGSNYRVRAGRSAPLKVRLTPAGRRLVKRKGRVRSRIRVTLASPLGELETRSFRVTLVRRGG